jgi:lipopolysaccharide biosynthesis regulator YciM
MQRIQGAAIARYLILNVCLLSLGARGAIAQTPTGKQPPRNLNYPSGAASPQVEVQTQSSMSPQPITPTCPFPNIPLSPTADRLIGLGITVEPFEPVTSSTGSESYTPGDGSDADLVHRVAILINDKKLDEAFALAQTIRTLRPRTSSLLTVAEGYIEAGQLDRAFAIVQPLPETPDRPGPSREGVLSTIVTAYQHQGNLESAIVVANQMQNRSAPLQEIARDYGAYGQLERAATILSQALTAFRTGSAFSGLSIPARAITVLKFVFLTEFAADYLDFQQPDKAVELLDEAMAEAKTAPEIPYGIGFEVLSATPMFYQQARQEGKAREAIAFVAEIAEHYSQPMTRSAALIDVAQAHIALQQPDQARALLARVEAEASADRAIAHENIIWVELARTYGALGQYDRAFQAITHVSPVSLRDQVQQTLICSQRAK